MRSVSMESSWKKEQIGDVIRDAIRERQKEDKNERSKGKGEEFETKNVAIQNLQKVVPLGFTDGNTQFFEGEVKKLGFHFKKMQKWKTYTVYRAKYFAPLKFREESKIRITQDEVCELLLCNN